MASSHFHSRPCFEDHSHKPSGCTNPPFNALAVNAQHGAVGAAAQMLSASMLLLLLPTLAQSNQDAAAVQSRGMTKLKIDAAAHAPSGRISGAMATLPKGRVAYVGGAWHGKAAGEGSHALAQASNGFRHPTNGPSVPLSTCVIYDAASDSWSTLPDMSKPRESPGSCAIGETLYVFGGTIAFATPGSSTSTYTASVEALDLSSPAPRWVSAPPLPSKRTSPSVTALADGSGCIIAGGFDASSTASFGYLKEALLFNGSHYTKLPDLRYGRSNMGIAAAHPGVYVIGGGATDPSYYNASILRRRVDGSFYDHWEELVPLHEARSWSMIAALRTPDDDQVLVAAGGMSLIPFFDPMASVEVYDIIDGDWQLFDEGEPGSLSTPTGFGSGAAINSTHMLAGGGVGSGTTGDEMYIISVAKHA